MVIMNIVVFGVGMVGFLISELLCYYGYNVIVIDDDLDMVRCMNNDFDVWVICGLVL